MVLTFAGMELDTCKEQHLSLPVTAYDGEVVCDLILSYGWLAENQAIVNPRRHGIHFLGEDHAIWVPGVVKPKMGTTQSMVTIPVDAHPMTPNAMVDPLAHVLSETQCDHISQQWEKREHMEAITSYLWKLGLRETPEIPEMGNEESPPPLTESDLQEVADHMFHHDVDINFIKGFVHTNHPMDTMEVGTLKQKILDDYASTVFTGHTTGNPPKRGAFSEAEIILRPGAVPVKQRPYQMTGERRAAWVKLTDQLIHDGKIEPGNGPWCSPSFPVPKKKPGTYRLVVDYRRLNEATVVDSHPLPRIGDILQRQGKFQIWSVLDMKDGYHQVPLKEEHRNLTCMTTPRGVMRWRVLVMGLKNGNAIFQRVMEEVLRDLDFADPYVDDVIVGSTGGSEQELIRHHDRDLRKVLDTLQKAGMVADPAKAQLFVREVEFCGHILREGTRIPSPGKLLPIQKWELPTTLTKLRGFLGLCNYYEEYVPDYANIAWKVMEKLKVKGANAKAGSNLPLVWEPDEVRAFEAMKKALGQQLSLHQVEPDHPFQMRTDASHTAIGAVLNQERGKWVPVCFFSRKLTPSQVNWSPREKEAYAVVASLIKWSGWIGTSEVTVITDDKSLESWVKEYVETPSGPTGRRARWHEVFSQFNLSIVYQPGPTNIVADAMSRYAYPASMERQDVSVHGSADNAKMVSNMEQQAKMEAMQWDISGYQGVNVLLKKQTGTHIPLSWFSTATMAV